MSQSAQTGRGRHPAPRGMGLIEVFAIAFGGIVAGGIFSVLGLTAQAAGGGAYISFIVGGLVTLATGYSYAKLSAPRGRDLAMGRSRMTRNRLLHCLEDL